MIHAENFLFPLFFCSAAGNWSVFLGTLPVAVLTHTVAGHCRLLRDQCEGLSANLRCHFQHKAGHGFGGGSGLLDTRILDGHGRRRRASTSRSRGEGNIL